MVQVEMQQLKDARLCNSLGLSLGLSLMVSKWLL